MAQYGFDKNGNVEIYSKYSMRGVNSSTDIFPPNEKTRKLLKLKGNKRFRSVYNKSSRAAAVKVIFLDFIIIAMTKLANGGMLVFPGTTGANISLQQLSLEGLKRLKDKGAMPKVNLTKARFKLPIFKFSFGPTSLRKDRFIYPSKSIWNLAYRNAEAGTIKYTYYRKRR